MMRVSHVDAALCCYTRCNPWQTRLKAEVLAEGTATVGEGRERGEDDFEGWAAQAGIKAPKLRHEIFPNAVVGDLR